MVYFELCIYAHQSQLCISIHNKNQFRIYTHAKYLQKAVSACGLNPSPPPPTLRPLLL